MSDLTAIRRLLESDRPWAAYALGDLAPRRGVFSRWNLAADGRALTLVYREFTTPVLFAMGSLETLAPLLEQVSLAHERIYLHVDVPTANWLGRRYRLQEEQLMWRMAWDGRLPTSPPAVQHQPERRIARLAPGDLRALEELYADGQEQGEAPDFFYPQMLALGPFYGVWHGDELLAAAGTHLCEAEERVAAIGNVYTRRDQRGQGWATQLMWCLLDELRRQGIATVVLNVKQTNQAAQRIYERLGFGRHMAFVEALAVR